MRPAKTWGLASRTRSKIICYLFHLRPHLQLLQRHPDLIQKQVQLGKVWVTSSHYQTCHMILPSIGILPRQTSLPARKPERYYVDPSSLCVGANPLVFAGCCFGLDLHLFGRSRPVSTVAEKNWKPWDPPRQPKNKMRRATHPRRTPHGQ